MQNELYEKTGNIGGVIGGVIGLVAGMGVATLVLIFIGVLGGQTYNLAESDINDIANNEVVNQSFTALNGTAVSLGNMDIQSGTLTILNNSVDVGLGNFTIDYSNGLATLTNAAFNNTALDSSYTWGDISIRNYVKESITSGFKALNVSGSYLPLIVLAMIITIVLSLVLGMAIMPQSGNYGGSAL